VAAIEMRARREAVVRGAGVGGVAVPDVPALAAVPRGIGVPGVEVRGAPIRRSGDEKGMTKLFLYDGLRGRATNSSRQVVFGLGLIPAPEPSRPDARTPRQWSPVSGPVQVSHTAARQLRHLTGFP
jgi:hypothetical protein